LLMPPLDASRILRTLSELRVTPSSVFGSGEHEFQLNPPLSEAETLAFERAHNIALPNDFRQFLTSVGNGGAGPCYGIFPLGYADDSFDLSPWKDDGIVGDLSVPFLFTEEWNDLSGMPSVELHPAVGPEETEYDRAMEAFEKVYWRSELINGAIPICHEGCSLRIYLVVTGTQAGYLWEDRRSEYGGIRPVLLADGSASTFASWYDEWLNTCVTKDSSKE
jgi:hypothetical protein